MNNIKFTIPTYDYKLCKRIPRKLKKEVKVFCNVHWVWLSNPQRMWYYMEKNKSEYKSFLIKKICEDDIRTSKR